MNLSKKTRAAVETALEAVLGLAAATPVILMGTGVSSKVGAGAAVLAVSVGVTNLVQVPAVERFLDRMLGSSGEAQLVSLTQELQGVEQVVADHLAAHSGTPAGQSPAEPSASSDAAVAASSPEAPSAAPSPAASDGGTPSGAASSS